MKFFTRKQKSKKPEEVQKKEKIMESDPVGKSLDVNLEIIKEIFCYPQNKDFVIRHLRIKFINRKGVLLYLSGMIDEDIIEKHVISPLLIEENREVKDDLLQHLSNEELHSTVIKRISDFKDITKAILGDQVVLMIDGCSEALALNAGGPAHRAIEKPQVEAVIKGPKEAFVESPQTNRSLVRKYVRNEKLITESINLGERNVSEFSMMYIKDIANSYIVEAVRKRISEIQTDNVLSLGELEQHIEERPYSLVPSVLYTERPDRAAAFLREGHVIILDSSPACLIVPMTFWGFFHTAEDSYQRWAYSNFIRLIRLFAFITALLTPSTYLAMTNFHIEMIPTDLLLAIGATREQVPFPVIVEVLVMEIAFELIREAGVRIPSQIGPTIGIVGALILGQAAVEASIVSPILVIIVALTGLSSFAIPEISTNYMVRIARFAFLGLAYAMGFLGISLGLVVSIGYLCSMKSFDVPFLAPFTPHYKSSGDIIMRKPVWKQWIRPFHMYPQDVTRQKKPEGESNQ